MKRPQPWLAILAAVMFASAIWLTFRPYTIERELGGCVDVVNQQRVPRSVVFDGLVYQFQTQNLYPKPSRDQTAEFGCSLTVERVAVPADLYALSGLLFIAALMAIRRK